MSECVTIACTRCRQYIWIGQRSGTLTLYTGERHTMEAFKAFLTKHEGHSLLFSGQDSERIAGFAEVKPEVAP